MDADIQLNGNTTEIDGDFTTCRSVDFNLDNPGRRVSDNGSRRALVHDFGDGLTLNFGEDYPKGVTVQGFRTTVRSADLALDYPARRQNQTPFRRAFVHDFNDGLTLNWARDYPGGVTVNGHVQIPDSLTLTELVPSEVFGGGLVRKPLNVVAEIHSLRNQISALQSSVTALQAAVAALGG